MYAYDIFINTQYMDSLCNILYYYLTFLMLLQNGEFDWDEQTQGMVLGCFFYGYLLTNYIGGRLAERFGGRLVYGLGVTLTAALTVISPYAARHSTSAFVFIRILEGMTEVRLQVFSRNL